MFLGSGNVTSSSKQGSQGGAHAPEGEGSASAAGPMAQSEYPTARKAAWAANATPSWAPRRAGRAALTTAIAAASVTIVPRRCGGGSGSTSVAGGGAGEGKPRRRSVGLGSSGVWGRTGKVKSHAAPLDYSARLCPI
jgi:hypothetical protein